MPGGVLGCGWTTLRYFDADGDGIFESLEYVGFGGPSNATRCPTFPEWALSMLPNKAATERCKKNEGKINFKLPPLWDKLLDQQPVMPSLVSDTKK